VSDESVKQIYKVGGKRRHRGGESRKLFPTRKIRENTAGSDAGAQRGNVRMAETGAYRKGERRRPQRELFVKQNFERGVEALQPRRQNRKSGETMSRRDASVKGGR